MLVVEVVLVALHYSSGALIALAIIFVIIDIGSHFEIFNDISLTASGIKFHKDIEDAKNTLFKIDKAQKDLLFLYVKQLEITGGDYVIVNNIYMKILDMSKNMPNLSEDDDEILGVKSLTHHMYLVKLNGMEYELESSILGKHKFENIGNLKNWSEVTTPKRFKKIIGERNIQDTSLADLNKMLQQYSKVYWDKEKLCKETIV